MTTPIFHLFHLGVDQADLPAFHEAGVYNLTTSQREEAGTLAMYASSFKNLSTEFIVFEVYADETAYQIHKASPQYQHYVDKVGEKLTRRESFDVETVFMQEKLSTGEWIGQEHFYLKYAQVETTLEGAAHFEASVLTNMKRSLEKEEGVLAMYAMRDQQKPTSWYFYEVYASQSAYEAHRETEHFQTYIAETSQLLVDKQLHDLLNDVAVTKGAASYSIK